MSDAIFWTLTLAAALGGAAMLIMLNGPRYDGLAMTVARLAWAPLVIAAALLLTHVA